MSYKGLSVTHGVFGKGVIVKETDKCVVVQFEKEKDKKEFLFENVNKFLVFEEGIVPSAASTHKKNPKSHKSKDTVNYAIKCNYCDGGASGDRIGFCGLCSKEVIDYNINTVKRSWCSFEESNCRKYMDGQISYEDLMKLADEGFLCYEANVFTKWSFGAGYDNSVTPHRPRRMPGILPGGLCLITTVYPDSKDRVIAGAFIIDDVYEGDDSKEGYGKCSTDMHITFSEAEAKSLLFWDYYSNPNSPESKQWGTGLYRKMSIDECLRLFDRFAEIKKDTPDEDVVNRMRVKFCEKNRLETNPS